jgi:hypothetical protein
VVFGCIGLIDLPVYFAINTIEPGEELRVNYGYSKKDFVRHFNISGTVDALSHKT